MVIKNTQHRPFEYKKRHNSRYGPVVSLHVTCSIFYWEYKMCSKIKRAFSKMKMAYFSMVYIGKWRTKEEGPGLETRTFSSRWTVFESYVLHKKNTKDLPQDLRDPSEPSIERSTVSQSLHGNGLSARMTVKNSFFRKGNWEKMPRMAKLHKKWTGNQWQWIL